MDLDEEKGGARESQGGPVYECVRCGRRVSFSELERYISFRCPYCGYRVFRKIRAPIVKRVKAR
ncbi:DNA-directed RNA polymerase subunit P [Candidatus Bathyarchaeota archaeon]|nr:MAG: DNA-directed RNA polymerase subunit P [Candidatus Bathyarchaeota archaeon]